jgi:GAF domain-containing protein
LSVHRNQNHDQKKMTEYRPMIQQTGNIELKYTAWRAGFLRATLISACILGLMALVPAVLASSPLYAAVYVSIYIFVLLITFLPISYNIKAGAFIFLLYGLAVSGLTDTGIYGNARPFMLGAITIASLVFSWRTGWFMTVLAAITYFVFGWLILSGNLTISSPYVTVGTTGAWLAASAGVMLIAVLIVNGIRLTQIEFEKTTERSETLVSELQNERTNLELRIEERTQALDKRTNQLQAVAESGRSITTFRNLSELLRQAAEIIHKNFEYYHVGIFLLDERREYAVLAASNSEGGQRMLERQHQLKVGGASIVGYAIEHAEARIALDVGQDAVYFDNPDLPQTRSEMALPLIVSGQILGALDVQSTEAQAFTEDDVATLQILAEQIAVAIQNANLFSEAEKSLEAARIGYGEISREAWGKILRNQPRIGFLSTSPTNTLQIQSDSVEPNLAKAAETGDLIIDNDGLTIGVPIKIRGQVIGAIRLKKPEIAESWTQDEINLAIALSDQLSGALESARLYRESQTRAARESLVSDISARINAATQMDAILRETVSELGQALGNAAITFQLLEQPDGQKQPEGMDGSGIFNRSRKAGE